MDANFEKAVFERIVEWSSKSDTSQCFLITPKIQVSIVFVSCAFLGIQLLVLCVLCCILGFALSGALMLARSFRMFIYIRTHTHTHSLVYIMHTPTHTYMLMCGRAVCWTTWARTSACSISSRAVTCARLHRLHQDPAAISDFGIRMCVCVCVCAS